MPSLNIVIERFSVGFSHNWIFALDDLIRIADEASERIEDELGGVGVESFELESSGGLVVLNCHDYVSSDSVDNLSEEIYAVIDDTAANFDPNEDDDD